MLLFALQSVLDGTGTDRPNVNVKRDTSAGLLIGIWNHTEHRTLSASPFFSITPHTYLSFVNTHYSLWSLEDNALCTERKLLTGKIVIKPTSDCHASLAKKVQLIKISNVSRSCFERVPVILSKNFTLFKYQLLTDSVECGDWRLEIEALKFELRTLQENKKRE